MTETRTRVSGDYIKPSCTQPNTTTRTRVSGDYIKPSSSYCGRTIYASPPGYSSYASPYFFSTPRPVVYASPSISARRVTSLGEDIAGFLVLSALCIGAIALIVIAPRCHYEEICQGIGLGLDACHMEQVCLY